MALITGPSKNLPSGIVLTDSSLQIGSQTYFLRSVTSVRVDVLAHTGAQAVVMIFVLFVVGGIASSTISDRSSPMAALVACGVVSVLVFIAWRLTKKIFRPTYALTLVTAAGETSALTSPQRADMDHLAKAITEAVIRGK